jgi:hypothetical protein
MIRHFHQFSNQVFGKFLSFGPVVSLRARGGALHWLLSYCAEPIELQLVL